MYLPISHSSLPRKTEISPFSRHGRARIEKKLLVAAAAGGVLLVPASTARGAVITRVEKP